jgi:hypothetical protein
LFTDLIDQLAQHQSWQVQHCRSAHSRSDVGRARGQVPKFRVVGKIKFGLERAVYFVNELESLSQLQTGANRLHAQMILFVHHYAEGLFAIHDNGAAHTLGGVFATDQMPFHQHLLFQRGQILEQFRKWLLHFGELFHPRLDHFQNDGAFRLFRPAGKRAVA